MTILAAYVPRTARAGYRYGLSRIDKEGEPDLRDEFIRDLTERLNEQNYKITAHTESEIGKIVDLALERRMTKTQFRQEVLTLFSRWKVHRPATA